MGDKGEVDDEDIKKYFKPDSNNWTNNKLILSYKLCGATVTMILSVTTYLL